VSAADEIAELKAATREAHETLKDLRAERRSIAEMLVELRVESAGIPDRVRSSVQLTIENQVAEQVNRLGFATEKAMRASVAKVQREFDRLASLFLGTEPGQTSLEELISARKARGG
jgi:uncharacterized coiled-coil DUF342 family protein